MVTLQIKVAYIYIYIVVVISFNCNITDDDNGNIYATSRIMENFNMLIENLEKLEFHFHLKMHF